MKAVTVSHRIQDQIPEFIKDDNTQFVAFLEQYYKSQEKSGKPYDILGNILRYADIGSGEFDPNFLSSKSAVLEAVNPTQKNIIAENVNYFLEKDGTIQIDNEVIYYESVTHSPDIIFTPGVNKQEFDRKIQEFEPISNQFDGVKTEFELKLLGDPVSPSSAQHLLVIVNNEFKFPNIDYFVEGDKLRLVTPPLAPTGELTGAINTVRYLIGYTSIPVKTLDTITAASNSKEFHLFEAGNSYSPLSTVSTVVVVNRVEKRPFEEYTIFEDKLIFKEEVAEGTEIVVRSVELIAPQFGSGASAISQIVDNQVNAVLVKNGGSGYRLGFSPRVSITSTLGTGSNATAEALVNGIKDTQLLFSGQGYSANNPPTVVVDPPADAEGKTAQIRAIVDDELEGVSQLIVDSSGSGYDRIPSIKFINPGGAQVSSPLLNDTSIKADSFTVIAKGSGYTSPPLIYLDPPTGDNAIVANVVATIDSDGQVNGVTVVSGGQGYLTVPRARVIDPVGAQILDVSVTGGRVTNIELLTGGKGYTDAPSVYIVDNRKDVAGEPIGGTGATAVATIFNGEITDINITSFGTGYSDTEPPQVYIAAPPAPEASCDVGFGEITGFTIHSKGSGYQPSAFVNCKRGVSAVTSFDQKGNQVYSKESDTIQSSHNVSAEIKNLDTLFAKELYNRYVNQYLPNAEIDYETVNAPQIIKTISDFYASKGTKISTQYLFKMLYSENVDVSYPKDEVIKPSAATWNVDTVLRADLISGSAADLQDSQLMQYIDPVDSSVQAASALIENVIAINTGVGTVYELAISEETLLGQFTIPYKTTLVEPLSTTESIITVDSTIGWPERNGTIRINDEEVVQYKEKTLNQFIECTRSKNGVVEDWDAGTTIYSDIFVYVNQGASNEIKLRVLGIADAKSTVLNDTGSYYLPGDKLNVASLGSTSIDQRITSWLYNVKKLISVTGIVPGGLNNQTATVTCSNNHGLLVGDSVTIYGANPTVYNGTFTVTSRISQTIFEYNIPAPSDASPQGNILLSVDLNKGKSSEEGISVAIKDFTTNVQNTFFNSQYSYIASSGIPNYEVGPFVGSALLPGNQRKLVRIPRIIETVSKRDDTSFGPIGAWVNGVSAWSYKSETKIKFGGITSIEIGAAGEGYDAANPPVIEITGGGGSGAAASVTVNGALSEIEVDTGGTGYTSSPLVSIVGGGGFGATATAVITNGVVSRVLVESPGQGYTSQPDVSISGGGGSGATATASVRGPIQSVAITSAGSSYTSSPTIKLNSGEGAVAQPIIINGRIVSIAIIAAGNGYTTAPEIIISGDGYGAVAKASIGSVGEDRGKVIGVSVINRGIGYTTGSTTIRLEAVGSQGTFTANVFEWTRNLQQELGSNFDGARGYVFAGYNTQYGGEYAHVSDPKQLRYVLGDNVFKNQSTQQLQELSTGYLHSPILGWAFDGNPIYGPYGYIDATNQSSGVRRIRSSYRIKSILVFDTATNPNPVRVDGPLLSDYPAGSFIEDYEYAFQEGDLDQYNGRFCKTPEYPEGVYAYFISIDASDAGNPVFPYICGPQLYSQPDSWNYSQNAVQTNIPADVVRFRDPYENVDIDIDRQPNQDTDILVTEDGLELIFEIEDTNRDGVINNLEDTTPYTIAEEPVLQLFDYYPKVSTRSEVDIDIETTTKFEDAQIDGFVIENPGVSYKVSDKLFFDNEDTQGFGASAKVSAVAGLSIQGYSSYMSGDMPYGRITTATEHELRVGDEIIVQETPILDSTNKTFKVKVIPGVENVTITQTGLGYSDDIPPTYELISSQGQDFQLTLNRTEAGAVNSANIVNSGSGYSPTNPPQIRVSHPQRFKKASYFLAFLKEQSGIVSINDIQVADDRTFYVCGHSSVPNGDTSGMLAKFNSDGRLLWKRALVPSLPASGTKNLSFKSLYVENSNPHNIYVIGELSPNTTSIVYNPDIVVIKYQSGFDNANNPDGIVQWQRDIAGISGTTRRDYATSIHLDQLGRVMIGGYTDSNSLSPDDMWVALLDLDGSVMEKRKIASASGNEHLHQLLWKANDTFLFCGISDPAGSSDIILGETFYDGVTIEVQWSKIITNSSYKFTDPTMSIDEYGSVYVTATAVNTDGKNYGVLYTKFDNDVYTSTVVSKMFVPTGTYASCKNGGVKFDVFGNIDLSCNVERDFNNVQSVTSKISWNTGNIINSASVSETNGIGYSATVVSSDNSGDTIVAGNKVESVQLAILNWDTADNLLEDTYNDTLATGSNKAWYATGNAVIDQTKKYAGTSSVKLDAPNSLALLYGADVATSWTIEGFWALGSTQYAANNTTPHLYTVTDNVGNEVKVGLDASSGANAGKVFLVLGGSTIYSTATTYVTPFNAEAFVHVALSKERVGVGNYVYRVYVNGIEAINNTSTTADVNLKDVTIGPKGTPSSSISWIGWIDNIAVSQSATRIEAYTPALVTGTNTTTQAFIYKLDKDKTKLGSFTLNDVETGHTLTTASNSNYTFNTQSTTVSPWAIGPAGIQILDYGDVVANHVPGSLTFTSTDETFASRTATIPTPGGKKLLLTTTVIPKFYFRDARYSSIDLVKTLTFNQNATFTKGSTLQQYSVIGGADVVSAYGVIVDTGANFVKIGKIIGTFDNTKLLKSTHNDVNELNQSFVEESTYPQWVTNTPYTTGDIVYNDKKWYTASSTATSGTIAPVHTGGTTTDGNVNWAYTSPSGIFIIDLANTSYSGGTLNQFASWKPFSASDYTIKIEEIYADSSFIKGDTIDADAVNLTFSVDATGKVATFGGLLGVKKISLAATLNKDVIPTGSLANTDIVYCSATSRHNFEVNDIIFTENFSSNEYNGSFFIKEVFTSRDFTYNLRSTAVQDPTFSGSGSSVSNVNIYAKHPKFLFVRGHQYIFDLDDNSNLGYYLSFSKDNQFKLEYPFINIIREGTPGFTDDDSPTPLVKFIINEDVTNISYYFDPSRTLPSNSPVGEGSFIDVIPSPYAGTFTVTGTSNAGKTFDFALLNEPEKTTAAVGNNEFGLPRSSYSTTSTKAIGPIASIKLVNPGGFYQKLPIVSDISSNREIEKVRITNGGTEYVNGIYYNVPIGGDGEGATCNITVTDDGDFEGVITAVELTSAGKGYTTASIDIDAIPGILGPLLAGSGGILDVVIPSEGSGASVFLQGKSIGKIKKLKNNEFGFGYSHDYTLKPEITFPVNLQLFNTALLAQIKITDPGSGYTSTPAVVIEGGGGSGAAADAIVKNNRLSEIIIKDPGSGYSSEPSVTLKSEFNYVVNVDLGYLQFNFPHGITSGAEVQLRAEDLGSTIGILPKPSSAGLVSLSSTQTYYAIAGEANGLESDQLRISLTQLDAESGSYITFLTQGEGRQVLLTEVFGGQATAIVETSRFLEGELVYQGSSLELASATGYVSTNEGWQIGPRILKLENYDGVWLAGERVTGQVSRASGLIDNLSIARGTLEIASLTTTPGQFIDDVGKPSEIVQKIQDSYFYQNFSYVIKSQTPINQWRKPVLETNHPVGFNLFGELAITGGKDISGRKVVSDLVKEVNINSFTNINQITSFANAQPIYTEFNNTEVLFRQKRLTNSEEILTSIVKKVDNISDQFDGIKTQFPLNVEGSSVTATEDQMFILLNGVAQSPGTSFSTTGPSIVFSEAPKAPSRIKFRSVQFSQLVITRMTFSTIGGIFPLLGNTVRSLQNEGTAVVIDSGVDYIDVISVVGSFQINDNVLASSTGFNAVLSAKNNLTSKTIYEQGERITNLQGKFAIIEENNLLDGVISDDLVVSRTSGTAAYETGEFEIKFNDIIYSARSKIAATVISIAPYQDAVSNQIIDTVDLSPSSTFFGLVFQRVPSITYPNVILDNISETVINPTELYTDAANNQDFLDFENVRNQEIRYDNLTGTDFAAGTDIRLKKLFFTNSSMRIQPDTRAFNAAEALEKNAEFIAEEAVGLMLAFYPSFTIPTGNQNCIDDIVDVLNMIAWQVKFDGNSEVWDIANTYVQGNSIYHVDGQVAQTVYAMEKARDLALKCINMEIIVPAHTTKQQWRDTTVTPEYVVTDNSHGDARALLLANKWYIAHESLHYAKLQNPGYTVSGGDEHCLSDIVDVIEALGYNTAHGGNDFIWEATDRILHYGVTSGDRNTIVNAFTKAKTMAVQIIQNNAVAKVDTSHGWVQFIDNTITNDPGNCAAVQSTITTLMDILINALGTTASPGTREAFQAAVTKTAPQADYSQGRLSYPVGDNACVNQTSAVTNFFRIITDTLQDPTGADKTTYQWSIFNLQRVEPAYAFQDSETIKCVKHSYKNKSTGGFFVFGDTVKGITSGNTASVIGSNGGSKWIYSKNPSGAFTVGEYITNSLLTNVGVTVDNLDYAVGTGSLDFNGSAHLTHPATEKLALGDGSVAAGDFTIELWIKATSVSGVQMLLDFRSSTSDTGAFYLLLNNNQIRWNVGNTDRITSTGVVANTWTHIAVTRSTGVTRLFVGGTLAGSYTDNTNYGNLPIKIGANASNSTGFTGHMENFMVKKGIAEYTASFIPSAVYDSADLNLSFGFDGEAPIPIIKGEIYATFQQTITSTASADGIELWRSEIMTEEVDLSRQVERDCADIIETNKFWIAEEAVGRMKAKYPDFVIPGDTGTSTQGTDKCLRDTYEYIIPAIYKDLRYGGNYNSIIIGRGYLANQQGELAHVNEELLQSMYVWREVAKLCIDVITKDQADLTGEYTTRIRVPNYFSATPGSNITTYIMSLMDDLLDVLGPTGHRFRDGADLLYFNRKCIADEVVYWLEERYTVNINNVDVNQLYIPGGSPGREKCVRDIRDHIIPAIATDLITGGNSNAQGIIDSYLNSAGFIGDVEHELLPMLEAIGYAKWLMEKALQNLLLSRNENIANLPAGSTNANTIDDFFQFQYTDLPAFRKAYDPAVNYDLTGNIITESTFNPPDPKIYTGSHRALDAADLINANKRTIAEEAVDLTVKQSAFKHYNFRVPGGKVHCEDDIVDILDGVIHDLRFSVNEKVYEASELYLNSDMGLKHVTDQADETIYAMRMARDMAILAIQNKLGFNPYESAYESGGALGGGGGGIESRPDYDYNAGGGFATSTEAGNKYYDASNEIKNNLRFIATTAVGRGLAQYSSLTFGGYGYQSCVDDVVDVLEAVVFNLAHGGNNIVWYASDFYITISNAVQHINSQAAQVKYIFEQARDIAIQVMRQELVTVNGYTEGYAVYDNTITIDNNGATTGQLTPTDATYTPTNGNLVLTKAGHNLQVGDSITLDPNSLVFNCTFDGNQSNKSYPRPWDPASGATLPITARTNDTFTVDVGTTSNGTHDVSFAIYEEDTGNLFLDIGTHNLTPGRHIRMPDNAVSFLCPYGNGVHTYVSGVNNAIVASTGGSHTAGSGTTYDPITGNLVLNIGSNTLTAPTTHTASNVAYNPTTGVMTITVTSHPFSNGDQILIADNSLSFTCGEDSNATNHYYPRPSDPASGKWLTISNVSGDNFDVQVLANTPSTNQTAHNFVWAKTNGISYATSTVTIADGAVTFTCDADNHGSNHSYPRSTDPVSGTNVAVQARSGSTITVNVGVSTGSNSTKSYPRSTDYASGKSLEVLEVGDSTFTATNATYNPVTGIMVITSVAHGFNNGDQVMFDTNSLNFTCSMDNYGSVHSYPRLTDPAHNIYLPVQNKTNDTFEVNVGTSPTQLYSPSNVVYNPTTGDMVITIGSHSLVAGAHVKLSDNAFTFTCLEDNNATTHSYPRTTTTTHTSTDAAYNPTTGIMTLRVPQHGFVNGDQIKIADNSLIFKCAADDYSTNHSYPRSTDPASGSWLEISNVTTNTFDVQVLLSTEIPSTNTTTHAYQSSTASNITWKKDRAYDVPLTVKSATDTTITVNVLASGRTPSTNTTTHTFISAAANSVSVGGNYTHQFVSAKEHGIRFRNGRIKVNVNPSPTIYQYPHTFISAISGAVEYGGNYTHTFVSASSNAVNWVQGGGGAARCSNQASAITTLMNITVNLFDSSNTSNPRAYLDNITRTLPGEWPLTGERASVRDTTITYDQAGNGECAVVASSINTLFSIPIGVIQTAAAGNGSYLVNQSITKTVTPVGYQSGNTLLSGGGICYNVTSAAATLADLIEDTLGGAPEMYRQAAKLLMFNNEYIDKEAYYKSVNNYSGYAAEIEFGTNIRKAMIYDIITGGNIATIQLVNSWFDSNGNFVAYPGVFRTYLIYHAEAVKEYMVNTVEQDCLNPGPNNSEVPYTNRELRPTATAVHKIHQLFHLVMVGLERSSLPTVYLTEPIDVGVAVNTDGSIDSVGHKFEAYDVVNYIVLGTAVTELDRAQYYIHPNTTANKIYLAEYIDGDAITSLTPGTPGQIHTFSVGVNNGIERVETTYGTRDIPTPIQGGINTADIFFGDTSEAYAEVIRIQDNLAQVLYKVDYVPITHTSGSVKFENGEQIVKVGATGNTGTVLATDNATYIKVVMTGGTFANSDNLEGITSGATATASASPHKRILVNFKQGEFIATDIIYSKQDSGKANALIVRNNDGSLLDNQSGRVTYDVSTVVGSFEPGDVIYGSVTDQIIEIEGFNQLPNFGEYLHTTTITRFTYAALITDTGVTDTFQVGDTLQLQNAGQSVGHTFVVTEHDTDNNYVYLANETGRFSAIGDDLTVVAGDAAYTLAKIPAGSNFPSVYTQGIAAVTITNTSAYGRIEKIEQIGIRAIIHLGDTSGTFVKNAQIIGDYGFRGACSVAKTLRGRVRRFFRGFDGVQKNFKLTQENGTAYFPDPAGHMMIFVNGILQPPGGNNAFTAFSDNIQFTEAPAAGSSFHGVYVGKLRQLDDISFDFDSLRNSFNLKLNGVFYSLTLTDGVQSNTILPENNIICQLNGVIQEPGIGFELVGSRIIFSEVPRAGSTFVAFSYVGSDVDVIAATVVPPIEAGDNLFIEGEEFEREVALIESSNSLITFEYTGSVRGRNADALATIEKGRITEAILTNSGDGYTSRPNVDVISSSGFGGKIKALVGLARIDVKNAGQGYVQPTVTVSTTVADDFLGPTGEGVNGGIDIYDPNYIPTGESQAQGEVLITVASQPVNVTVNQGQTAAFTVVATTTPSGNTINYQWQKKDYGTDTWINIDGATSSVYTTPVTTQGDGGDEYRVGLTSTGATPTLSNAATLTINIGATTVDNFTPDQIFDDN